MLYDHEDTCEKCLEPSDDLDDNLICLDCKIGMIDFVDDYDKYY